jgi:hypothetical protein
LFALPNPKLTGAPTPTGFAEIVSDDFPDRGCQLAVFSGKLRCMEAEIDDKMPSNSGKNRNRPKKCVFKDVIIAPNPR